MSKKQRGHTPKITYLKPVMTTIINDVGEAYAGKLFFYALASGGNDILARIPEVLEHRKRKLQGESISNIRQFLYLAQLNPEGTLDKSPPLICKNSDSLLGLSQQIIRYFESEARGLEKIATAVMEGSEAYRRQYPIVEVVNYYMFQEYRAIANKMNSLLSHTQG